MENYDGHFLSSAALSLTICPSHCCSIHSPMSLYSYPRCASLVFCLRIHSIKSVREPMRCFENSGGLQDLPAQLTSRGGGCLQIAVATSPPCHSHPLELSILFSGHPQAPRMKVLTSLSIQEESNLNQKLQVPESSSSTRGRGWGKGVHSQASADAGPFPLLLSVPIL